jgi:methionine-rich copper-binding protein CopC
VVRDATGATSTSLARTVTVNNVADTIAPTVTVRTPAAGAVNVAANTNITATFSENIQGLANAALTTGTNFRVVRTSNNVAVTALVITYNPTTRVATFDPLANLLPGVQYTATLTGGPAAIRDIANNPLVTTSWNFTIIDNVAPTVTARTPAANATGVTVPVSPTATFSEALNAATVTGTTMTIRVGTTVAGALIPSLVTYNPGTQVATINPNASLLNDTVYTVRLTNGIQDVAGNALAATQWTFTTGPAPTVTAQSPAPNATGVSRAGNATATFSENMNAATVTGTNVTLRLGTAANGTLIAGTVTYNAGTRVVTINPTVATLQANTQYTVRLLAGLTDTVGNTITPVSWTFRTGA